MSKQQTIEELVRVFEHSVSEQENAQHADVGNKFAEKRVNAFETLVKLYGDSGREELCGLLNHDDPSVRGMAAAYLLRYVNADAMKVLIELRAGSGIVAVCAKYSIMNWENGSWELDLVDEDNNPLD